MEVLLPSKGILEAIGYDERVLVMMREHNTSQPLSSQNFLGNQSGGDAFSLIGVHLQKSITVVL